MCGTNFAAGFVEVTKTLKGRKYRKLKKEKITPNLILKLIPKVTNERCRTYAPWFRLQL